MRSSISAARAPDMHADVLAFGPHPDDLEIGLGATLAKHAALGHRVGLCDLTRGELASNGTPEVRLGEAEKARAVLGAAWRENLGWPDRGIGSSDAHVRSAATLIRRVRPRVIAIPYWDDRHPDHGAASSVLTEAVFNARLRRYAVEGEPWNPEWVCYYFINDSAPASFVLDVSAHYETKRRALACYRSQFEPPPPRRASATFTKEGGGPTKLEKRSRPAIAEGDGGIATRLTSPRFMQLIESRDAHFGALAGVAFAEGFIVKEPVLRPSLLKIL
jgi:bacillithiol biosynthesis deacetylase BshB1